VAHTPPSDVAKLTGIAFRNRKGFLRALSVLLIAGSICGCGGSKLSSPAPGFSLSLNSTSLSVAPGATQMVSISATASNGFSQSIAVTVSGTPAGVTASPSSFTLMIGTPQQVGFSAASSAAAGSASVLFTGAAGKLSSTASLALTVTQVVTTTGSDVVTYHNDVERTGLYPNESALTLANVNSTSFGLLRVLPVDGLVDAQPLYLSNLTVAGKAQNVVFAVTEHASVFAFNADTGAQLWTTSVLGANETTSDDHGCGQISPEIGISPASARTRCDHRRRTHGQPGRDLCYFSGNGRQ